MLTSADYHHRAEQLANAASLVYHPRAFNAIMDAIADNQRAANFGFLLKLSPDLAEFRVEHDGYGYRLFDGYHWRGEYLSSPYNPLP
jgi:hypothetical protein